MNPSKDTPMTTKESEVDVLAKFRAEVERGLAELRPPEHMTTLRAEYWTAGARAAIRAVNTALRNAGVKV